MEDLKLQLFDRIKSESMDSILIPAFLKALTNLIPSEPEIQPTQANQEPNSLGWNEVTLDYHSLQISIARLELGFN
jgi:hypothetical protein